MTAVAGALERVSKLFVEGYIPESEFAMLPEEDTEVKPAWSCQI